MIQISIIVPVYNVQDYLNRALDSLYRQNDADRHEIILVNDGSTDKSYSICKQYKRIIPNTILIDKNNGGLSDARNAGIAMARGEYVFFLDSDDWLAPNALEVLYDFAKDNNCEVVQGGFYYAYDDHLLYDAQYKEPFVLDRSEAMFRLIQNDYVKNFAWGKLYKSEIAKRYPFPKGKYFEDSYWQHLVMNEITNYGIVPTPLYYYRQHSSSISGEFSIKNLDLLKGYEERLKFVQNFYPKYLDVMSAKLWLMGFSFTEFAKNRCDTKTIHAFTEFWQRINESYYPLFDVALHSSIKYRLWKSFPKLIKFYEFINKVIDRVFKKSTFVRIDYNG